MAEFCKECFKRCIEPGALDKYIIVSEYDDLCEGCGEIKKVVIEYNTEGNYEERT